MRRYSADCHTSGGGSVRKGSPGCVEIVLGHGFDSWIESSGMMPGWKQRRAAFFFLSLVVFLFANASYVATEETSFVVSRSAGEETPGLGFRDASLCGAAAEERVLIWKRLFGSDQVTWPEGQLRQRIPSEASGDGASDIATGPCIRQTKKPLSCPVKCFRADPVCGTDKVTYWCGVADAKCAGVEVAHDGFCNLWELDTNIGSTMALCAAQSLQLVHILWLLVAGLLIILGLV